MKSAVKIASFAAMAINNITTFPQKTSNSIDIVTLSVKEDFPVFFDDHGLYTILTHVQNVRSVTIIGRQQEKQQVIERILKMTTSVPIHFVDETFFKVKFNNAWPPPYPKVFQQLIKLHVFELPWLLNNVLIVDSDTAWSKNVQFIHNNGTRILYFNEVTSPQSCTGMDPTRWVNTLLPQPCEIISCAKRHILHHMVFQRDVMHHMHNTLNEKWGTQSAWQAIHKCWNTQNQCRGRVSEYKAYYQFAKAYYERRIIDKTLHTSQFIGASGNCSTSEMLTCAKKNVILKGCHDHRKNNKHLGLC